MYVCVCGRVWMGADKKCPDELWVISAFSSANQHYSSPSPAAGSSSETPVLSVSEIYEIKQARLA